MELMIVMDVMLTKGGQTMLTGPLLLKGFSLRSEIEQCFGTSVKVLSINGEQARVPVKGIWVSQAMSGAWQVSLAIDCPSGLRGVALETLVTSDQ